MYLIKLQGNDLSRKKLTSLGSIPAGTGKIGHVLLSTVLAEERTVRVLILLALLVLLIHCSLWFWLRQPLPIIDHPQPLMMNVSIIPVAAPKPKSAPLPPPPAPASKKPAKKKPQPKPKLKNPQTIQKHADFALLKQALLQRRFENFSPSFSSVRSESFSNPQATSDAFLNPDYENNPKPEYPPMARSRGWQGTVVLRVAVSAEGYSDSVSVERSSGHEILDESAVEAIKQWRFTPAKQGETAVESSVLVPIIFTLRN